MVRVTGSSVSQHDCWSSLCIVVRSVLCIIKHWCCYLFKYKWSVLNWLVNIPTEVAQGYLSALRCHISKLQHTTFVFSICKVLQKANERNDFSGLLSLNKFQRNVRLHQLGVYLCKTCNWCYYTCTCEHKHTQFPDWSMENSVTSSWQTPQTNPRAMDWFPRHLKRQSVKILSEINQHT